jgi:hypothetical protein
MRIRTTAAAVLTPLALAAPVAAASADTAPAPAAQASPVLTFVPPRVGPIGVSLGPIIIGGRVISPGVNVATKGVSLPSIAVMPRR